MFEKVGNSQQKIKNPGACEEEEEAHTGVRERQNIIVHSGGGLKMDYFWLRNQDAGTGAVASGSSMESTNDAPTA